MCPICNKIVPVTGTQADSGILCECNKIDLLTEIKRLQKEVRELKDENRRD